MLTSNKDNDSSVVFTLGDEQFVNEIVVVRTGDASDLIVVIRGHISVEDVMKVVGDNTYYPIK